MLLPPSDSRIGTLCTGQPQDSPTTTDCAAPMWGHRGKQTSPPRTIQECLLCYLETLHSIHTWTWLECQWFRPFGDTGGVWTRKWFRVKVSEKTRMLVCVQHWRVRMRNQFFTADSGVGEWINKVGNKSWIASSTLGFSTSSEAGLEKSSLMQLEIGYMHNYFTVFSAFPYLWEFLE